MKLMRTLVAPLAAAALMVGCTELTLGPNATNEEIADALVGSWTATSMVVSNDANPSETVDLLAEGVSFTLTMTAEGAYTGNFSSPGENESFSGTYVVNGFSLTLSEEGDDDEILAFTLADGLLILTMDESWDFDEDGTDEDATMVVQLRQ